MTSSEVRNSFLKFFKERQHTIVSSSPVVPYDDPTLLFTNAGMNQFKDVFLGTGKRTYTRAADTQKCIRVSGKHNDLEEVGRDTYHHTFFEMLGNWSFGDYYKKEAIEWAWELLTKIWKLPKNRLWVTVYKDDGEAEQLWKSITDINPSHVLRFGEKDNFWEMGETGPCGPCSEIHIDRTPSGNATPNMVNAGLPELMEIWNLVFIQYNRDETGKLTPLPAKHVDTGMGFERICAVLQDKQSNYDTDVFKPIISFIENLTNKKYGRTSPNEAKILLTDIDIAFRVIADHTRMLTFSIADGAVPSNKDRGYVLTQILKRASRFGRVLNMHEPFVYKIVDAIIESMGSAFPEIKEQHLYIKKIIKESEEKFSETEINGYDYFYKSITGEPIRQAFVKKGLIDKRWYVDTNLSDGNRLIIMHPAYEKQVYANIKEELNNLNITSISGADAFKLHDTYGLHIETTEALAKEIGLSIDKKRYEELMEEQRRISSEKSKPKWVIGPVLTNWEGDDDLKNNGQLLKDNDFLYDTLSVRTQIEFDTLYYVDNNIRRRGIILKSTTFYAESGGQVSDIGNLIFELATGEKYIARILDVQKYENRTVHVIEEIYPKLKDQISSVVTDINKERRLSIMRNHSATHIMHEALRRVLGSHIHQSGSLVAPEYLRFDFNHSEKVTPDQLKEIENIINEKIEEGIAVNALNNPDEWVTIEEAKRRWPNIKMFFGEKYSERVRVVETQGFCAELCGGTHVNNTGEIGYFKVRNEGSIASGVRRIEAVTHDHALELLQLRTMNLSDRIDYASQQFDDLIKLKADLTSASRGASEIVKSTFDNYEKRLKDLKHGTPPPDRASPELAGHFDQLNHRKQVVEEIILKLTDEKKILEKELARFRLQSLSGSIDDLIASAVSIDNIKLVAVKVSSTSADELKSLGDTLRVKLGSGIGLLASVIDDKVQLVCVVTDDLVRSKKIEAGKVVGTIAKLVGGGGGGRPHMATAGGKDINKIDEAIAQTKSVVESLLRK